MRSAEEETIHGVHTGAKRKVRLRGQAPYPKMPITQPGIRLRSRCQGLCEVLRSGRFGEALCPPGMPTRCARRLTCHEARVTICGNALIIRTISSENVKVCVGSVNVVDEPCITLVSSLRRVVHTVQKRHLRPPILVADRIEAADQVPGVRTECLQEVR